jgi:hypothetical protein
MSGTWRVQSFTPEDRLEAPLQSLLDIELGQLTITFSADSYTARGPGVDVTGRFKLDSGEGDLLSGALYDSTGVGYRISAAFEDGVLKFRSYDSPWRGSGTLLRAGN